MKPSMKAVGMGAGGHAKVVLEILLQKEHCSVIGLLDANATCWGKALLGVPILGGDGELGKLIELENITGFFIGVGAIRSLTLRRKLYEYAVGKGLAPLDIVHPSAHISPYATLGAGVTAMVASTINASSRIGDNVIINTGAIVEHGCTIGNHIHIATGACLSGGVEIGNEAMIGAGAVIRQGIRIGNHAVVGAGAVVVKDVADDCVVAGNPAKIITGSGA